MRPIYLTLFALVLMSGCMPEANEMVNTANAVTNSSPAGFFLGWWHGTICWLSFIISLFDSSVNVYEVHNTGAGYNFGFVLGAGILFGGGGSASS